MRLNLPRVWAGLGKKEKGIGRPKNFFNERGRGRGGRILPDLLVPPTPTTFTNNS